MLPFLVRAFLTLFVVIDPVGLTPIFISLVGNRSLKERNYIARRAILVAGAILLLFTLFGTSLLRYLNVSIEAFQIAAGFLLFKIAVDMVFAQQKRETEAERKEAQEREDISVFPLAIPLIAGPGTLASILILSSEAEAYSFGLVMILAIALLVLLIAYTVFCLSGYLAYLLGQTGINVITRLLGVLLSALAVQYIANGVVVLLKALK